VGSQRVARCVLGTGIDRGGVGGVRLQVGIGVQRGLLGVSIIGYGGLDVVGQRYSGAAVSTITLSVLDAEEVLPAASVARTSYRCSPSYTPATPILQLPSGPTELVPSDVVCSKSSTVLPASAVPETVMSPVLI
jgi:hypothetical protein